MNNSRILLIIPAFNESGNIKRTVEEAKSVSVDCDILVVDDGSEDDTASRASEAGASVISMPFNLGVGGAVQTGFLFAQRAGYHIAVQVDGDGQHDLDFLGRLLDPVIQGEADIAVGSRFSGPYQGYRSSFVRRVGIHFFAKLISFLTGFKVTDPTSGFRAFSRRALAVFAREYPMDFPEPESIVVATRHGLKLREVPVQMRKRLYGASSIRYLKTLYYMIKVTFAILLDMLKQKEEAQ